MCMWVFVGDHVCFHYELRHEETRQGLSHFLINSVKFNDEILNLVRNVRNIMC